MEEVFSKERTPSATLNGVLHIMRKHPEYCAQAIKFIDKNISPQYFFDAENETTMYYIFQRFSLEGAVLNDALINVIENKWNSISDVSSEDKVYLLDSYAQTKNRENDIESCECMLKFLSRNLKQEDRITYENSIGMCEMLDFLTHSDPVKYAQPVLEVLEKMSSGTRQNIDVCMNIIKNVPTLWSRGLKKITDFAQDEWTSEEALIHILRQAKNLYSQKGLQPEVKKILKSVSLNSNTQAKALVSLKNLLGLITETSKHEFKKQDYCYSTKFKLCYENRAESNDAFFEKVKHLDEIVKRNLDDCNGFERYRTICYDAIPDIDFIFCGKEMPSPNKFQPITGLETDYSLGKPKGGLWTSPWNKESQCSEWEWYCDEDLKDTSKHWHIVPTTNCRFLNVKNDLSNLKPYIGPVVLGFDGRDGYDCDVFKTGKGINFQKLARDYDAVYISKNVQKNNFGQFELYDVGSCIFLHPKFMVFDDKEYKLYKDEQHKARFASIASQCGRAKDKIR